MTSTSAATLSRTFAALSDPTRRDVVVRLSRGDATVGELAAPHTMSLPAFTKHIGVLVGAGVVTRRRVGRTVVCSLDPAVLSDAEDWLHDLSAFWTGSLDRLERLLAEDRTHPPHQEDR